MSKAIEELVRKWWIKAEEDYITAEYLINSDLPVYGSCCFHCQQTVEKFLKSFLVYHGIDFKKTHDVDYLRIQCGTVDKDFLPISFGDLYSFAVEYRYPDDFDTISKDDALEYFKLAYKIKQMVLNKIKI